MVIVHKRVTGLDMLGIEKSGVYCIMPFSSLDKDYTGLD